jgi:predicted methyltransferase
MFHRHVAFPVLALAGLVACGNSPPPASPTTSPAPSASAASVAPEGSAASATPVVPDYVRAAVDAADRSPEDRALDAGRKPDLTLAFFGIRPGMKVAEIGAGGGYTTELLARVVGPSGKVYGQNSPMMLQKFANVPWTARLAKPALSNVVRADREFDDPLPPEATGLDAVIDVLFYHDTVWIGTDREKMNRAIFAALKPGGIYGIVDHSALPGSGLNSVQTLHRIEESTLRAEVEHAGFELVEEATFLRNPKDTRDWSDSPKAAGDRRGTSDRFVLKFKRP